MPTKATVRQQQCAALLCAQGYMPSGASALVGNFSQECGANINCSWRSGKLDHGSQGLAQWRLDRLDKYEAWVRSKLGLREYPGDDEGTLWASYGRLDLQCEYVAVEMRKDYPKLDAALRKGGSVSALTAEVCWQYERPSKLAANLVNRTTQALATFNTIPGGASHAHDTDIRAAMDQVADNHAKTAVQGGATAAAGGVLGAVGLIAHSAEQLAWWEWTLIGIVAFLLITGITAMLVGGSKAQLVRNAKAQVDPDHVTQPASTDARDVATDTLKDKVDPTKEAHDAEQAAIDRAMKHGASTEDAAHAGLEARLGAATPGPIMSVHPGAAS